MKPSSINASMLSVIGDKPRASITSIASLLQTVLGIFMLVSMRVYAAKHTVNGSRSLQIIT